MNGQTQNKEKLNYLKLKQFNDFFIKVLGCFEGTF